MCTSARPISVLSQYGGINEQILGPQTLRSPQFQRALYFLYKVSGVTTAALTPPHQILLLDGPKSFDGELPHFLLRDSVSDSRRP